MWVKNRRWSAQYAFHGVSGLPVERSFFFLCRLVMPGSDWEGIGALAVTCCRCTYCEGRNRASQHLLPTTNSISTNNGCVRHFVSKMASMPDSDQSPSELLFATRGGDYRVSHGDHCFSSPCASITWLKGAWRHSGLSASLPLAQTAIIIVGSSHCVSGNTVNTVRLLHPSAVQLCKAGGC